MLWAIVRRPHGLGQFLLPHPELLHIMQWCSFTAELTALVVLWLRGRALLAAAVQSNFAAHAPVSSSPADAMARINKALLRRAIEARFATMFYGSVMPDGQLSYCNAGQEPPLVVRAGDDMSWLEEGGPVLGLLSIATYAYETVPLHNGDLVVVCSDGVTEARNLAGGHRSCCYGVPAASMNDDPPRSRGRHLRPGHLRSS